MSIDFGEKRNTVSLDVYFAIRVGYRIFKMERRWVRKVIEVGERWMSSEWRLCAIKLTLRKGKKEANLVVKRDFILMTLYF